MLIGMMIGMLPGEMVELEGIKKFLVQIGQSQEMRGEESMMEAGQQVLP